MTGPGGRNPAGRALALIAATVVLAGGLSGCDDPGNGPSAAPSRCGVVAGRLVPRCGALWGVSVSPTADDVELTALQPVEVAARRKIAVIHRYHDMSSGRAGIFPDPAEQRASDGRLLYLAWASRTYAGANFTWRQVASGELDATIIDPAARRIADYGRPLFMDFDHEPEAHKDDGPDGDYVAAYRHVRERFLAAGATNVVWVWAVTGFEPHWPRYRALYPGDDVVDWVAWDPYNFAHCKRTAWRTFEETIAPFHEWLVERHPGKPLMLAEYGTAASPDGPEATADWYEDVVPVLRRHPRIKAAVHFNYAPPEGGWCDTRLRPAAVLDAWGRAARDPYVNPPLPAA